MQYAKNSLRKLFEIFWDQVVLTNDDLLLTIHEKSAQFRILQIVFQDYCLDSVAYHVIF